MRLHSWKIKLTLIQQIRNISHLCAWPFILFYTFYLCISCSHSSSFCFLLSIFLFHPRSSVGYHKCFTSLKASGSNSKPVQYLSLIQNTFGYLSTDSLYNMGEAFFNQNVFQHNKLTHSHIQQICSR